MTVPYDHAYRETFVKGAVYERKANGTEAIFFERHYDREALASRLLGSEAAEVIDLSFWGEGTIRMETVLNRLGPLRAAVSPVEGPLSALLLRPVDPDDASHAMAAFFTLRALQHKPNRRDDVRASERNTG